MAAKKKSLEEEVACHTDGSSGPKEMKSNGVFEGHCEWFRKEDDLSLLMARIAYW